MKIVLINILLLLPLGIFAQRMNQANLIKIGTVNPREITEDWFIHVQNLESPSPDGDSFRAELQRRKLQMEKRYPRNGKTTVKDRSAATLPLSGIMFEGNAAGGGTPNDNTMAISNGGMMVSSINSNVYFYDITNDSLLSVLSLTQFSIAGGFTATNSKYDPKALYDPEADRFILTYLNGSSALTSKVVIAFSSSNNPMDPWNIYWFPGNPLNNNRWTDYPAIEVNENDFFCTGNLIVPGEPWQTGFEETLIWNCDKSAGYNGDAVLPAVFWDSLIFEGKKIRNLHPIRNAQGNYTDKQYFLSNRNFSPDCDSLFLITLDGALSDGNQTVSIEYIQSDQAYFVSVDALQPSGHKLATNDSRVLGGSHEGNYIQFVQNSTDTATGNCSIFHGIIDLTTNTCHGFHIANDTLDFGYPNMASTAIAPGEQETMITLEYSSANDAPGFGVVYFDGTNYSPYTILHQGEDFIDVLSDTLERWGDYSATQRKYDEPCRVWASGAFGKSNNNNGTWIAEISASDTCRTYTPPAPDDDFMSGTIYPNPGNTMFTFDFTLDDSQFITIELYDVLGRLVKVIYEDVIISGQNRLTFSTAYLSDGNYYLQLRNGEEKLIVKKLQVVKE